MLEEFEASTSSKKTKTIYISTVISIAMVLLMVGLLGLILVHAHNLSRYVKENIVLNIIFQQVEFSLAFCSKSTYMKVN